jgi:hypothetical protein
MCEIILGYKFPNKPGHLSFSALDAHGSKISCEMPMIYDHLLEWASKGYIRYDIRNNVLTHILIYIYM